MYYRIADHVALRRWSDIGFAINTDGWYQRIVQALHEWTNLSEIGFKSIPLKFSLALLP